MPALLPGGVGEAAGGAPPATLGAGRETISGLCGPLAARCVLIRQLPPKLIRSLTGSSKTRKQAGAWLRYSLTWHSPHAGFLNSCRFQNSATGWKKHRETSLAPPKAPPQPTRLQHPPSVPGCCRPCPAALAPALGLVLREKLVEGLGEGGIPADFPSTASPPPSPAPSLACPRSWRLQLPLF